MATLSKVFVTQEQKDYLELIIHEDSANSIGGEKGELGNSVQWCIDMCMMIEQVDKDIFVTVMEKFNSK